MKLAQEIQPAGPGHDGHDEGGDRRKRRGRVAHWTKLALVAAVVLSWAALGVYGATVYGHNYYRFRGFSAPRTPRGVAAGRLLTVKFFSRSLGQRRSYLIYLPPGYSRLAATGHRFPVFYFLHGSPGWPSLIYDAGHIGVDANVLLHQHRIRPFIMVMPDGRNGTFTSDTEWANTQHGAYESFVMDVVHAVDKRWATIPKRADRVIAGNSEGAYAALNLSLHHLKTFGALESWSGYVLQSTVKGPFKGAPFPTLLANEPPYYLPQVAPKLRKLRLRAYIYTGNPHHNAAQVIAYAHQLRAAGGKVTLSVYKGGHDWRMWRLHAPQMLQWASRTFGR